MIKAEIKKWGNSLGVILPIDELRQLGLSKGDQVELEVIPKKRIDGFGMCKGAKTFFKRDDIHKEFW